MIQLSPADIFSTKGKGPLGWLAEKLFVTPKGTHTNRYHFGFIGDPVIDGDGNFVDFETRESLGKGPACFRFFKQYIGRDIELYRIKDITTQEALRMIRATSAIGNRPYGYKDFFLLFADLFRLLFHGKFPPYTAQQLKYSANEDYICTELVAYAARQIGKPIEPLGQDAIWDLPVVYEEAVEEGRLIRYYKGELHNSVGG